MGLVVIKYEKKLHTHLRSVQRDKCKLLLKQSIDWH